MFQPRLNNFSRTVKRLSAVRFGLNAIPRQLSLSIK